MRRHFPVTALVFLLCFFQPIQEQGRAPLPAAEAAPALEDNAIKYWVFLRDKGPHALSKSAEVLRAAEQKLTPRALARRAKVRPNKPLVDETDLPLHQPYLDALRDLGVQLVNSSNWLNAVSILAQPGQLAELRRLPFVKALQPVARLAVPPVQPATAPPVALAKPGTLHRYAYGLSLTQMDQIRATILHDAGITGRGVLIGVLDTGFNWQTHPAFQSLYVRAERDFIKNDEVTRNQPGDPASQDLHGTQVLSALAAFRQGELIGPAFAADFLLAKTENIASETHAEEDYWVVALEWMEARGVEVTSTSLGYSTFDPGQVSYTPADMDGKTAIITKAAELAASKGIIVLSSAGNEGGNSWNIITAPADGPNVLAVGAVNASGGLVSFSGRGPTADGRIKPDIMALGTGVRVVASGPKDSYTFGSGTSFACPLAAGVVAQILSAHPDVTPQQMLAVLRATASRANAPDNEYGYGIINAWAAATALGPAFSNVPDVDTSQGGVLGITVHVLSRAGLIPGSVKLYYAERTSSSFSEVTLAQVDSISYFGQIPRPLVDTAHVKLYYTAVDPQAGPVTFPKRAPQEYLLIRGDGTTDTRPAPLPREFELQQSRPNPFRLAEATGTTITFSLVQPDVVRLRVYNLLGQVVRELLNEPRSAGLHPVLWDGRDQSGRLVPSGVYFYELSTPAQTKTRKLLLLR